MISYFHSASTFAPKIDHLAFMLLLVCGFFIALVWALMIYFCVHYRASAKVNRKNPPDKNRKLELSLIVIILIFGLTTFGFSARLYYRMYTPPANAREIFGTAKQWMWIFHDPNGKDQINELTVPVNVPIKLTLISEDVIHSLFIPAFRVKQDVLPGRYTSLWFTATQTGDFPLFCTQYCGLSHSNMIATVHVVDTDAPGAVQNFTETNVSRPVGETLFQEKGCVSCHAGNAPNEIGPNLRGIYQAEVTLQDGTKVLADDAYLHESIVAPAAKIVKGYSALMPAYQGTLNENEIRELIDYIKQWKSSKELKKPSKARNEEVTAK
jgi:cytochrome c oxidase subunit 2